MRGRREAAGLAPLTDHVVDLLHAAVGDLPRALYMRRLMAASSLYLTALVDLDGREAADPHYEAMVLKDVLETGVAVLLAHADADVRAAFDRPQAPP
jgi:hypothetical protein